MVSRQPGELRSDLPNREPHSLREDDERDTANHGARIATMPGRVALGLDQALRLVEAECRGCNPAALRNLADGERFVHKRSLANFSLDFKCT